jgi:hypothetical protein
MGKSVRELKRSMDSVEMTAWMAFLAVRADRMKEPQKRAEDDDGEDVIEYGEPVEDDEDEDDD